MSRRVAFVALSLLLGACASPGESGPGGNPPGSSAGPGVDLGGFIQPDTSDLSTGVLFDFAIAPAQPDMAQSQPPTPTPDMSQPPQTSCGAITFAGTCTGSTLRYCSTANQLTTVDCAPSGRQCTVVAGDADCRFVAGSACGSVTIDGVCDGDNVVYCNTGNTISIQSCPGSTCVRLFGYADCL